MKIRINTEIISKLNPCQDRFDNWKRHYENFDGDVLEFLSLENISLQDKYWVAFRLMPRFLVEVFAIECAVSTAGANDYAAYYSAYYAAEAVDSAVDSADAADAADSTAAYAAYAAYASTYTAPAPAYAYAYAAERRRQMFAIKYLIETYDEKEGGK